MVRSDLPTPVNAELHDFADIDDEVIIELLLRALDAEAFDVFGNEIEALVGEIEIVRRPRHRRTKFGEQDVDAGYQPVIELRIIGPVADRALAPMLRVFVDQIGR